MRDTLLGKRARLGAVGAAGRGAPPRARGGTHAATAGRLCRRAAAPGYGAAAGYGAAPAPVGGGSFLGTAAATAAGVVGGALLMNSFRGMFGGGQQAGRGRARSIPAAAAARRGAGRGRGGGDLARQAGLDDIGRGGARRTDDGGGSQRAGLFDSRRTMPMTDDVRRRRRRRRRRRFRRRDGDTA